MIRGLSKQYNYNEIVIGLIFLYLGIVYFSIAISNIFLVLAISLFIYGMFSNKIELDFKTRNCFLYLIIIAPFVLTLISVFYSENSFKELKYIWLRLPILLVPFILLFMKVKNSHIITGLKIFVLLTILATLGTIYNALRYINEGVLFEPDLASFITIIQHPYFGVFVLISLFSIIEFKLIKTKSLKNVIYILFIFGIILTTSRLVYILFFLVGGFYLFNRYSKKKSMFLVVLLSVFTLTFIITNKNIKSKFQTSFIYEKSPRLKLWNNSYKVITSSNSILFGIGIGDYYKDKKDAYFFKETINGVYGYNPHSQVVEFFVTNGLFGLFILLINIILGVLEIRKQNNFAIIVLGIIVMFSLTESILNRQYGVQLFSIFIPLIFKENFKKIENGHL